MAANVIGWRKSSLRCCDSPQLLNRLRREERIASDQRRLLRSLLAATAGLLLLSWLADGYFALSVPFVKATGGRVAHSPHALRRFSGPSDVLDEATVSNGAETIHTTSKATDVEEVVGAIKVELIRLGALTGRGLRARESERAAADALVSKLEECQPAGSLASADTPSETTGVAPAEVDGLWELVFSDVEPFRASVFFQALAVAVEEKIKIGGSDGSLPVHRLATSISEVGRVAYDIQAGQLRSLVELKVGLVPSLPFALEGTVVSSGVLTDSWPNSLVLTLQNTSVQESTVAFGLPMDGSLRPGKNRDLLAFVANEVVPSGSIFESVLGEVPEVRMEIVYVDEDFLVLRTPQVAGHYFAFGRGDREAWPALSELEDRGDKSQPSLFGSLAALGMLNPFISRGSR